MENCLQSLKTLITNVKWTFSGRVVHPGAPVQWAQGIRVNVYFLSCFEYHFYLQINPQVRIHQDFKEFSMIGFFRENVFLATKPVSMKMEKIYRRQVAVMLWSIITKNCIYLIYGFECSNISDLRQQMQLGMKMHQLIVSEDFVDTLLLTREKVHITIGSWCLWQKRGKL